MVQVHATPRVDVQVPFPGTPVTTNGNQLVAQHIEARVADAGIFYPITPSTEMGEAFQLSVARGEPTVFGDSKMAIEAEGEHAAQGGAIACSVAGKRVVNFTSGQGVVYGLEQYFHAPGKLSTMVVQCAARALTKHALNVHCGHDDVYACFETGWTILFAKDAQQAADQALILRKVNELTLTPGINAQDGFLTSHLERTFLRAESELIRRFLGRPDDIIPCPTESQRRLFGPSRRRIPKAIDLEHPALLGSVQNQEHYMTGVAARRQHFVEPILDFLRAAYDEFAALTGRRHRLVDVTGEADAETVVVALGSAAENVEAALDTIRETRGERVGVVHINVLRPFPEADVVHALQGRKRVIVLERTDDQLAGDGPLGRDIRTALSKALENGRGIAHPGLPSITPSDVPRIFSGVYGLGSRDFRPEGVLGAIDFALGRTARQDGLKATDGASFFYVGIDHPYAVVAKDAPSLLPEGAVAVRFHSIGGWGMITTGKNLSEVLGGLSEFMARTVSPEGPSSKRRLHISANPKYGSEKKGAPTNYFLVVADERIRVNCDLAHVDVVLCCDPRIFLHANPLAGLKPGGAFVWESSEPDDEGYWSRIPSRLRAEIIQKRIRLYSLPGFAIAKETTPRQDLQYRMQGNAFLGAFFGASSFLADHGLPVDAFRSVVRAQYEKKFGKLGSAVVESNVAVMEKGYARLREVRPGSMDALDRSAMRGDVLCSFASASSNCVKDEAPPLFSGTDYDSEFRSGKGYFTPSSPRAATGIMAAATGATNSKYGSRRQVPKWIASRCTQCMACITSCPDTALPNTAQEIGTLLRSIIQGYTHPGVLRDRWLGLLPELEVRVRAALKSGVLAAQDSEPPAFDAILLTELESLSRSTLQHLPEDEVARGLNEIRRIATKVPVAYAKTSMIFTVPEKKRPGSGGVFSIFVSDLCKGCGECVKECGEHEALVMIDESEDVNADLLTGTAFLKLLPDTPNRFLGSFDPDHVLDAKAAALHFHLMVQRNYQALVSGDGACAGCGEKSVLRAVATVTEALMRPVFHAKASRLVALADRLETEGERAFSELARSSPEHHARLVRVLAQILLGLGGETEEESRARVARELKGDSSVILSSWIRHLRNEAEAHGRARCFEGGRWHGMATMAMTASTGCNTVFGSTHPANPHPYPWMNSLFQDGATIGWLVAETFISDHARRSVLPERLAQTLLAGRGLSESEAWGFLHFTDALMTDQEILELPKVWAIGGDGGFGDIGFQNVSKAVLQNRPNLKIVLLDTQVYSNTGGQNSDSSPMPGGFDMNQIGAASEGKLTEKKGVAEAFTVGHGSAFVAQVSMANAAALYRVLLDGLAYRGTAFIQSFTTCQPEHGVGDDLSTHQAHLARDSRGMPEWIFDPSRGEDFTACLTLKGNPHIDRDWTIITLKHSAERYEYTVAHWAATEARFRNHLRKLASEELERLPRLEDLLARITQDDVVHRRYLDPTHRSYVSPEGARTRVQPSQGALAPIGVSRQMVLWCVERRKSWRLLQSRAGIRNLDREAQSQVLREVDQGRIPLSEFLARSREIQDEFRSRIALTPTPHTS